MNAKQRQRDKARQDRKTQVLEVAPPPLLTTGPLGEKEVGGGRRGRRGRGGEGGKGSPPPPPPPALAKYG